MTAAGTPCPVTAKKPISSQALATCRTISSRAAAMLMTGTPPLIGLSCAEGLEIAVVSPNRLAVRTEGEVTVLASDPPARDPNLGGEDETTDLVRQGAGTDLGVAFHQCRPGHDARERDIPVDRVLPAEATFPLFSGGREDGARRSVRSAPARKPGAAAAGARGRRGDPQPEGALCRLVRQPV